MVEKKRRRRPERDADNPPFETGKEEESPFEEEEEDTPTVSGGWGQFKKHKEKSSYFPEAFKPGDDEELVKFLDDEPFATYRLHWINEIREGQRGFVCWEDDCPLCERLGDNPSLKAQFNILVAVFDEEGNAEWDNRVWTVGVKLGQQLEGLAKGRTGPLTKHYWAVTATKTKKITSHSVNVVKGRDLAEDWQVDGITDEQLDKAKKKSYDSSSIRFTPRSQLDSLVDDLLDR